MSIKINRLEEGHNSYPLVCWRPAETVSLQRRQICYRWGTPAYWSLVPRSRMFYLFEFCLKNMWNCSLTQQILSHSFYDWKLYELFLLSGFLICHAVGWYIELKNQKFWWRIPERKILISGYPKNLESFQNPGTLKYFSLRINELIYDIICMCCEKKCYVIIIPSLIYKGHIRLLTKPWQNDDCFSIYLVEIIKVHDIQLKTTRIAN